MLETQIQIDKSSLNLQENVKQDSLIQGEKSGTIGEMAVEPSFEISHNDNHATEQTFLRTNTRTLVENIGQGSRDTWKLPS